VSTVTTHILDTARGRPASGVDVFLERLGERVEVLAKGHSNDDGRVADLGPDRLEPGDYRLRFATAAYFAEQGQQALYPEVVVVFTVSHAGEHYHLPLLLGPFSFSTYRGS
jgi:5-hydroxyisourate hydrolase